ncbi:hypothetical protein RIF29_26175 [Crotalaria pallida]|uniref:Uncharacterized protein n=1 Tax=Crotalaria pallida TaxID=3830 RepID=A0AAN9EPU4_CROPI
MWRTNVVGTGSNAVMEYCMNIAMWNKYGRGWKHTPQGWAWTGYTEIVIPDPEHQLSGANLEPHLGQVNVRGFQSYEEKVRCEQQSSSIVADGVAQTSHNNEETTTQAASSSRARRGCKKKKELHPLAFNRKVLE